MQGIRLEREVFRQSLDLTRSHEGGINGFKVIEIGGNSTDAFTEVTGAVNNVLSLKDARTLPIVAVSALAADLGVTSSVEDLYLHYVDAIKKLFVDKAPVAGTKDLTDSFYKASSGLYQELIHADLQNPEQRAKFLSFGSRLSVDVFRIACLQKGIRTEHINEMDSEEALKKIGSSLQKGIIPVVPVSYVMLDSQC